MEQNYYLFSQKTFLMALFVTWAKYAIKILSSWELSAIFESLGDVSATIRNFRRGFCKDPKKKKKKEEKKVGIVMEGTEGKK